METTYKPQKKELEIYEMWEQGEYFKPFIDRSKQPFVIIMPPPNANASLHIGHAVFVTIEDIMIRYHRMKGEPTLWLPGADHAGIATQVSYEKELAKQRKTKFDLGQEEFYKQVYKFTMKNREVMEEQLRKLGASCDWSRRKFTLDPKLMNQFIILLKKCTMMGLFIKVKGLLIGVRVAELLYQI